MRIVVAGVSGSGKSTIGALLAERTGSLFLDADAFHPPENIAKMSAGIALTDEDRAGWLEVLGMELSRHPDVVLACSALKRGYRDRLRNLAGDVRFILLSVGKDVIRERIRNRAGEGHFMPPALLESQFATLETGEDVIEILNDGSPDGVVARILDVLRAASS